MSADQARATIEAALGAAPTSLSSLSGGCVAEVYRVRMPDGADLVAKVDPSASSGLALEGWMLQRLRRDRALPVPAVHHAADDLLVMDHISHLGGHADLHAADLLAALHGHRAERCGLERDTVIGGLPQPNPWTDSWVEFFAQHRLREMARQAHQAGKLPDDLRDRVDALAGRLGEWLDEPPGGPSLLHGDVWGGNVLIDSDRVAAFVDPAIYYGHPEVELAFVTLFATFGDAFFTRYRERAGLAEGFFETRRDLYNLYPLLVHVRLFGGAYVHSVRHTLDQYGA